MDITDKAKIAQANRKLLATRLKLGQNRANPKPIRDIDATPKPLTPAEQYIEALRQGKESGNPKEIIMGDYSKWRQFKWEFHPSLTKAKPVIVEWLQAESDKGRGLILAGNCGCGKTHIAEAIAAGSGPIARFVNEVDLIKAIQATYNNRIDATEESILARYKDIPLLIYDDLGAYETENAGWLQGIYYALFNGRQESGKDFIITTNLPLVDGNGKSPLEDWLGARLFSRITGQMSEMKYYIDLFDVPDYRLKHLID